MSGARDRYDPGGKSGLTKLERIQRIVREGTQAECARRTIDRAFASGGSSAPPESLERQLVDAFLAERGSA